MNKFSLEKIFDTAESIPLKKIVVRNYSDFDYENLCELYFKHDWLHSQANHQGFENLWFDYNSNEEKSILKDLINNFTYLKQEKALLLTETKLAACLTKWGLTPGNTLFVGFKAHRYIDGSSILLNLFKPILANNHPKWEEYNFLPDFLYGKSRIDNNGFPNMGLSLKNIVLVDDFVGTGDTAVKRINEMKKKILETGKDVNLYMFTLAIMEQAIKPVKKTGIEFEACQILKKGTKLAYPKYTNFLMRTKIERMERILSKGSGDMLLEDFTLGYGKSEALYSWNTFNMPNNNYPIFWWHRYLDGTTRKAMFNRMQ